MTSEASPRLGILRPSATAVGYDRSDKRNKDRGINRSITNEEVKIEGLQKQRKENERSRMREEAKRRNESGSTARNGDLLRLNNGSRS